jgi:septin family protein
VDISPLQKEIVTQRLRGDTQAHVRQAAESLASNKEAKIVALQQKLADKTTKMNVKFEEYQSKLNQSASDILVLETVLTQLKAELERKDGLTPRDCSTFLDFFRGDCVPA